MEQCRIGLIRNQLFSDEEAGRVSPIDFTAVLGPSRDTISDGRLEPVSPAPAQVHQRPPL